MTLERQNEAHSSRNQYSPASAHRSRRGHRANPTAIQVAPVGKRKYAAYVESYPGLSSPPCASRPPAKSVKFQMRRGEEKTDFGDVGQKAPSERLNLPTAYPDLQGMASVPSMDAHFSPEALGDMGYHEWDPCELYPQTERSFEVDEESLDFVPGVTDAGGSCIMTHSPTFTVGDMSDDLMDFGVDLSGGGGGWSFGQLGTSEGEARAEEDALPPGFWQPNMLYERRKFR